MKTINFLFTTVFILLLGSCTNESQPIEEDLATIDFKGRKSQEKEKEQEENSQEGPVYLEGDLHLMALEYELYELELKIVQTEEEIESLEGDDSEGLQALLEQYQDEFEQFERWVDSGKEDYRRNGDAIEEILSQVQDDRLSDFFRRRPKRPPGQGGNPCAEESNARCNLNLENATIYVIGRDEIDMRTTRNGEECGGLADLAEVPGSEALIFEAALESEQGCADEIRFSGVNADGQRFSYSHSVTH